MINHNNSKQNNNQNDHNNNNNKMRQHTDRVSMMSRRIKTAFTPTTIRNINLSSSLMKCFDNGFRELPHYFAIHHHFPHPQRRSQKQILILIFAILLINIGAVRGKVIEGDLETDKNWIFLTRFCFLSREGIFEYNVSYPVEYAPQNLLLYFDARSQWSAVYKQNKTCAEKHSVLIDDFNQVINLTEYRREYRATIASGCKIDSEPDERNVTWMRCVHHRTFQSYRERWWFVALDNCDTRRGLRLRYRITMTNAADNLWLRHFSADQFYILHTDVIMCVLFYILLIASCFEAYALYTRHLYHKTYKLYIASLFSECIGVLFLVIYYAIYAQYGYASVQLRLIGKGFESISTLIFLLLLLLLSKGYTITRAKLKSRTIAKFSSFMVMSTVAYIIIFYHEQYAFDPGEVLYIYESLFGYLLVALRLLAWSWFSYAIIFTLIHYPQKSAFFAKLFLVYSIWFISAPIVIMIATFVIPKYMREKIINAVELAIAFKAHLIFFFLTRPSRANKNFPFHVRTTQIAIMEKGSGNYDTGTLEHFTNYKYAPTRTTPLNVFALSSAGAPHTVPTIIGGNHPHHPHSHHHSSNNTNNNNNNLNHSNHHLPNQFGNSLAINQLNGLAKSNQNGSTPTMFGNNGGGGKTATLQRTLAKFHITSNSFDSSSETTSSTILSNNNNNNNNNNMNNMNDNNNYANGKMIETTTHGGRRTSPPMAQSLSGPNRDSTQLPQAED